MNVYGNSNSNDNGKKINASLFVQKPFLRTIYIEANIEEDIDMKNQHRIKILPHLLSIREAASKSYVDNIFENDIDFNDVKLETIKFVKVNYQQAMIEHLSPMIYSVNAKHESSLVRNNQDNDFNKYNLTNIESNTLSTQAVNDNQVITKAYVYQIHQEDERSRIDLGIDFYEQSNDLVKDNQDKLSTTTN